MRFGLSSAFSPACLSKKKACSTNNGLYLASRAISSLQSAILNSSKKDYGPKEGDKVYVAMSGGVDSTMSAYLMLQRGFRVEGIYMRNWDTKEELGISVSPCEADWKKVQIICRTLNIPSRRVDFVKEYWNQVFETTLKDYESGRTPNPDLLCNKEIKFGCFKKALNLDSGSWLATGHYAQLKRCSKTSQIQLLRGVDPIKDQTYYLATVPLEHFERILFPLGSLYKAQVKALAREVAGLEELADQPESMGICFVGKKRYFSDFLGQYLENSPGPIRIIEDNEKIIGQHQGMWSYTVGQRVRLNYKSTKIYVVSKDLATNTLLVTLGRNHPKLYATELLLPNFKWLAPPIFDLNIGFLVKVKIRSTQAPVLAFLKSIPGKDSLHLTLGPPVWAPAPGQYVVLYGLNDVCLGAGILPSS